MRVRSLVFNISYPLFTESMFEFTWVLAFGVSGYKWSETKIMLKIKNEVFGSNLLILIILITINLIPMHFVITKCY